MFNSVVNDIVKNVNKNLEVEETTTSSDITYLPSGFTTLKPMLVTLSRMEKSLKIKVLDSKNKNEYVVQFGDKLNVRVPANLWEEFRSKVLNVKGSIRSIQGMEFFGSNFLKEASEDKAGSAYAELKAVLVKLLNKAPISYMNQSVVSWVYSFGKVRYETPSDVLLKWETLQPDTSRLLERLRASYKDDSGSIEMIADMLNFSKPGLNAFEVFKNYDFLSGTVIRSNLNGVNMSLDTMVDMSFNRSESIRIDDQNIVDEIEADYEVGVARGIIYPKDKSFPAGFYGRLKKHILDIMDRKEDTAKELI